MPAAKSNTTSIFVASCWIISTTPLAEIDHTAKSIVNGMRKCTLLVHGNNGRGLGCDPSTGRERRAGDSRAIYLRFG